jgi:hypothetical protein
MLLASARLSNAQTLKGGVLLDFGATEALFTDLPSSGFQRLHLYTAEMTFQLS